MTIGVVGLGAMGSRLAGRLLRAGHSVGVWNRTRPKAKALVDEGAFLADNPASLAARVDFLITMVADPVALKAVFRGDEGILAGLAPPTTVIEMSTVGPSSIAWLRSALPRGVQLLDAPVLGSVGQVEAGTLTIFVGGSQADVAKARSLLESLGSIIHAGPLGAGAAAKLVANASLFMAVVGIGEAIALGEGLGLSEHVLDQVLATTPLADQAKSRRPLIVRNEYPPRFSLALAHKDARLVADAAQSRGIQLRALEGARAWLARAEAEGWGDHDYTAVLASITGRSNRGLPAADPAPSLANLDGLIVDLDGVVWLGGEAIEGAAEAVAAVRRQGIRLLFLTNDPQSSREEQGVRLRAMNIPTAEDEVMTSAVASARVLRTEHQHNANLVFAIGSPSLKAALADEGFEVLSAERASHAQLVLVGGHEQFSYAELLAATRAVAAGARLFATNRDPIVPTRNGPAPATGAIVAAVETATGVSATALGKPEPYMFELARALLIGCSHVAIVGDSLVADISGGKRAGLEAILVLSGATQRSDLEVSTVRPDFVFDDFAALAAAIGESKRRGTG